jgi:hypothetical protein
MRTSLGTPAACLSDWNEERQRGHNDEARDAQVLPLPRGISNDRLRPVYGLAILQAPPSRARFAQWLAGVSTVDATVRLPLRGQHRLRHLFPV